MECSFDIRNSELTSLTTQEALLDSPPDRVHPQLLEKTPVNQSFQSRRSVVVIAVREVKESPYMMDLV